MSFTAEVKEELSRVEGPRAVELAQLAAMVRSCGTLSFSGQRRFRLSLSTETGSVARTLIKLFRSVYGMPCSLTVRRSVLHKTRNYLLSCAPADDDGGAFAGALVEMGVLTPDGMLARAIPPALVAGEGCAAAYLRGAFMAGGFVSEPRAEAHFELVAQTLPFAEGLSELLGRLGVPARVARRRGLFVIYLKSAEEIMSFLALVGAPSSALRVEGERVVKSVRNDTNRIVNAELANQRKAASAASSQLELIEAVASEVGLDSLPPALRDFCELRLAHPELSLRELGDEADPPLSKSAVYHRVRRLEELLAETRATRGPDALESGPRQLPTGGASRP